MTCKKQQTGAVLITSLLMLLVMTIIGVSAMKMSTLDSLLARNEQIRMQMYQDAETSLNQLVRAETLFEVLNELSEAPIEESFATHNSRILDTQVNYECQGLGGPAISIGIGVPSCRLYEFGVEQKQINIGARDRHFRGMGKEWPAINRYSDI